MNPNDTNVGIGTDFNQACERALEKRCKAGFDDFARVVEHIVRISKDHTTGVLHYVRLESAAPKSVAV